MGYDIEDVWAFWLPENGHWTSSETHGAFWQERMHGGMDEAICARFADLTRAAADCVLDHWAETPRGRLALILVLDQFSRSLWRDTPAAYSQDLKSARLALEGLENGHYEALEHEFQRMFYIIAISHCEGPDHPARMDRLVELSRKVDEALPPELDAIRGRPTAQAELVREVIRRFGRHPHRNAILGRPSTPAEQAYIDEGEFPHEQTRDLGKEAVEAAVGQG